MIGREFRLATRRLAHGPVLTIAAVATHALGIGSCTAMFSQIGDTAGESTYNEYRELARSSSSFERVALTGSANWPVPTEVACFGTRDCVDVITLTGNRHPES